MKDPEQRTEQNLLCLWRWHLIGIICEFILFLAGTLIPSSKILCGCTWLVSAISMYSCKCSFGSKLYLHDVVFAQILQKVLHGCKENMLGTMALTACQFMEEPGMAVQMRESQHPYNNNTNFEVRQAEITVHDLKLKSPRGWSRSLSKFHVGICGTPVLEAAVKSVQSCLKKADVR